ncbi:hypothetical protein [uncultured Pontibacter sp.]|uniref:hypothetical protein n=1 Tax=uncultured Pontibacter sp. TaxID=453356 RepID=UPI002604FE8C|nr:hypothetical protein [uncultured Pontibacter sp.]
MKNSSKLYIYVPYIKLKPLKEILAETKNVELIIVRWEPKDLLSGASDLEVYPFLKERGITLYRNKRLHMKAFLDNYERCLIGSANISSRALNIPLSPNYNYELATIVGSLSLEDRLYFINIEKESLLITDNVYEQIKAQLLEKDFDFEIENDFQIRFEAPDKDFLISSLPMSFNVASFFSIYQNGNAPNEVELNCFLHDLTLYDIPLGLSPNELFLRLQSSFFTHPFIAAFVDFLKLKGELRFGAVKEWIQKSCEDVPIPRRWEITENIQILYRWITTLGEGNFRIYQPNHSQVLQFVSKV